MELNLDKIKKSDIKNASSKVKIAYKNLEEYDKGNYEPDREKLLKELEKEYGKINK